MEGGVVTTEGDLLQLSEFQLQAGEDVPIGSSEGVPLGGGEGVPLGGSEDVPIGGSDGGAGVIPDDVIQETPEGFYED